jgi:hypothetical protein
MYHVFNKIEGCLVLDKVLDGDQNILWEGAEAGAEIRNPMPPF